MYFKELVDKLYNDINDIKKSKITNYVFVINAYQNIIDKILLYFKSSSNNNIEKTLITSSDIDKLDITLHMREKLKNIILEFNKNKNGVSYINNLLSILLSINGIGVQKAHELISNGLKNINDLKLQKYQNMISDESKLFYKYKPLLSIPRNYIEKIDEYLTLCFKSIKLKHIIGGSYRRKLQTSSDIDVLILSETENFTQIIKIINEFKNSEIYEYMRGDDKMSAIFRLKGEKYVKIDFMRSNKKEFITMLLYITGSKEFNIKMRSIAKSKNYLLNQRGLYKIKKDKNNNIEKILIDVKSEKEIFDILNMEYVLPQNRK